MLPKIIWMGEAELEVLRGSLSSREARRGIYCGPEK